MDYTVLFFTHSGAIKFSRMCKRERIQCELMPVPRKLSSNCSICAQINLATNIKELIDEEVEKVFLHEKDDYTLIYEAE